MVTKFEEAIGCTINNRKLRTAIQKHKTILSELEAYKKYGFTQDSLSALGDKMLRIVAKKIESESVYTTIPEEVHSNQFMYYYVCDTGLDKYFKAATKVYTNQKKIYHEYGTFFEAIVAGIFLSHGDKELERFCKNYFEEMSLLVNIFQKKAKVLTIDEVKKILKQDSTNFAILKYIVEELNDYTLVINRSKRKKKKKKWGLYIHFHIKKINQPGNIQYYFRDSGDDLNKLKEKICLKALKKIDPAHIRNINIMKK